MFCHCEGKDSRKAIRCTRQVKSALRKFSEGKDHDCDSFMSDAWASEGGARGPWPPWILKLLPKKGCFPISRGEKQISPLLAPLELFLRKSPLAPPWKKSFRRPWSDVPVLHKSCAAHLAKMDHFIC